MQRSHSPVSFRIRTVPASKEGRAGATIRVTATAKATTVLPLLTIEEAKDLREQLLIAIADAETTQANEATRVA